MSELKRCPFCGGEIKLMFMNENTYEDTVWDESIGNVPTWFRCYGCDSEFFHDEPIDIPEKQIEWWNNRKPLERIVEELEEELRLADEEKRRCVAENMLQFDSAKGYANGIYNALEIVMEEGGMNEMGL